MKPLSTNQRVFTWLCLLPPNENTSEGAKRSYVALVLSIICTVLIMFLSSLIFVLKFKWLNMEDTSLALFICIGTIPMANSIVVAFVFRHKIPPMFEKLSEIYRKHKDDDSFHFMARANGQSEWLWKMYFKFICIGLSVTILTSSIASAVFCLLWKGSFDSTLVFRPYRFVLPWDQSTLIGYFGEIIFSLVVTDFYLMYNGAVLLTFVSICLHHQAFHKIVRHNLRKLDRPDEDRNDKQILCEIIDFHNTIKSWFSDTADIYSLYLMAPLIGNMLILAIFVFQLDQQLSEHFDINFFIFLIFCIVIELFNLFLPCFLGKMASESYKQMAEALFDCNWHELPLDLQKYFVIMIADAQITLNYSGYGIITLNLETFCKLMRTVYTYYMMFKTLNAE